MLMLMNAWMMLVLMKCKCQMQCLTLGCYNVDVGPLARHMRGRGVRSWTLMRNVRHRRAALRAKTLVHREPAADR